MPSQTGVPLRLQTVLEGGLGCAPKAHACLRKHSPGSKTDPRACSRSVSSLGSTPRAPSDNGRLSASWFHHLMQRDLPRDRLMQREVQTRLRRLERKVGDDLLRLRTDAAATKAQVARAAGVDRTFYGRVESGDAHPSLKSLTAVAAALGAEVLSVCTRVVALGSPIVIRRGWSRPSLVSFIMCGARILRSP